METISRFLKPPSQSFFLLGPRGTGKSTWTKTYFPQALRIDLLLPEVFRAYSARPERLREILAAEPRATVIVIDEVQKYRSCSLQSIHFLKIKKDICLC